MIEVDSLDRPALIHQGDSLDVVPVSGVIEENFRLRNLNVVIESVESLDETSALLRDTTKSAATLTAGLRRRCKLHLLEDGSCTVAFSPSVCVEVKGGDSSDVRTGVTRPSG